MTISVNILQMWTFSFQFTWDPLMLAEVLTVQSPQSKCITYLDHLGKIV